MIESSIITKDIKETPKIFPKIMINGASDTIILVTDINNREGFAIGTVIHVGKNVNRNLGEHRTDWLISAFSDFFGEISLKSS